MNAYLVGVLLGATAVCIAVVVAVSVAFRRLHRELDDA